MPDYINLLNEIAGKDSEGQGKAKQGKFRTSIITTYSAYLPFYENVVLRRLLASGCRYNILLVDANELAHSLKDPTRMPRLAGRGYILAPIVANGAFHPKIAMLLGEHNARILVGSHNTTLSGFGYNRELTTRIDIGKGLTNENHPLFQQAWTAIEGWTSSQRDYLPPKLIESILRIGDDRSQWLRGDKPQNSDTIFLASQHEGESLWEKALPYLPKSSDQIFVLGPFFDKEGAFIRRLYDVFTPKRIAIGIDAEAKNISLCKHSDLPANVSFHNSAELIADAAKRNVSKLGYLHAKALFFDAPGESPVLITGSANPSAPAWLADPIKRNIEAVILHRGDKAKDLANALGLLTIPDLPVLNSNDLDNIYRKPPRTDSHLDSNASRRPLVAEVSNDAILIPKNLISLNEIATCYVFFDDQSNMKINSITEDTKNLYFSLEGNNLSITKLLITLIDNKKLTIIIHNPTSIKKLATTSKQQAFQDALSTLGGDSPDFETLFRVTDKLIFNESKNDIKDTTIKSIDRNTSSQQEGEDAPLGPLSVSLEETKHQQRQRRETHYGDLAFIVDALIYNLGIGLYNETEMTEDHSLNEEEQAEEDEQTLEYPPDIDKKTLLKTCHSKVHTLVNRMCKRFEIVEPGTPEALKTIEQLLAVLAVLREVRANDTKLSYITDRETLVPLKERRKLLEATLKTLFGCKKDLFDKTALYYNNDPDNDMARLLGLIIWLAWDAELNVQNIKSIYPSDIDTRQQAIHEMSKLFAIAQRSGKYTEAAKEACNSAYRVCKEEFRPKMILWMNRYEKWAKEICDLVGCIQEEQGIITPQCGDFGIAIKEPNPRFRVIVSTANKNIKFSELSEDKQTKEFVATEVRAARMPIF